MEQENNIEVFYTIPVEQKIMIRENLIKDWGDEDEIKKYISEHCDVNNAGDKDEIDIISVG